MLRQIFNLPQKGLPFHWSRHKATQGEVELSVLQRAPERALKPQVPRGASRPAIPVLTPPTDVTTASATPPPRVKIASRIIVVAENHNNPDDLARRAMLHMKAVQGRMFVVAEGLMHGREPALVANIIAQVKATHPASLGDFDAVARNPDVSRLRGGESRLGGAFAALMELYFHLTLGERTGLLDEAVPLAQHIEQQLNFACEDIRVRQAWFEGVKRPHPDAVVEAVAQVVDACMQNAQSIPVLAHEIASTESLSFAFAHGLRVWAQAIISMVGDKTLSEQAKDLFEGSDVNAFRAAFWDVAIKWRDTTIVDRTIRAYDEAVRAGQNVFLTVGGAHVLDIVDAIHAKRPDIPLAVAPSSENLMVGVPDAEHSRCGAALKLLQQLTHEAFASLLGSP